jgi:hypothetical protein
MVSEVKSAKEKTNAPFQTRFWSSRSTAPHYNWRSIALKNYTTVTKNAFPDPIISNTGLAFRSFRALGYNRRMADKYMKTLSKATTQIKPA